MKQAGPRSTRIPQKNRGKSTRIFNFADTLLEKLPPQAASQYHEQPGGRNGNRETSCSQRKSPQLIEYQVYPVRGLSGATPAEPRWTPDFIATPNRVIMFEPQQSANRQKQRRTQENRVSAIFWPVHAAMCRRSPAPPHHRTLATPPLCRLSFPVPSRDNRRQLMRQPARGTPTLSLIHI